MIFSLKSITTVSSSLSIAKIRRTVIFTQTGTRARYFSIRAEVPTHVQSSNKISFFTF